MSEPVFVAIGAIGFLILLLSLLFGELFEHGTEFGHDAEFGHDVDIGHAADVGHAGGGSGELNTPSWLSVRVAAASMVGFGASGFVAASGGLASWLSWPVAGVGFLAVGAGTYLLILKPLARQQYNSVMSRYNYLGQEAVVIVAILPGGTGQVSFRDRDGARVNQTASSDLRGPVAKGATVKIVDLAPGGVVVHHNSLSD
jgi:membrane protein implicated in regulation of membrane protease activity